MTIMSHATTLLGILQDLAPDGRAQAKCTEMFHQLERDGASDLQILRRMTNALADGLNHENWLWAERSVASYPPASSRRLTPEEEVEYAAAGKAIPEVRAKMDLPGTITGRLGGPDFHEANGDS